MESIEIVFLEDYFLDTQRRIQKIEWKFVARNVDHWKSKVEFYTTIKISYPRRAGWKWI